MNPFKGENSLRTDLSSQHSEVITKIFNEKNEQLCNRLQINQIKLYRLSIQFDMNKKNLQYAGYVLIILGLIGMISGTAPAWSRYTVLLLGIIIVLATVNRKSA